jgi:hypothetical protein
MRAELLALARKSPHPAVPARPRKRGSPRSPREKERRPCSACNSTVKRANITHYSAMTFVEIFLGWVEHNEAHKTPGRTGSGLFDRLKGSTVELTVKSWQAVGYFALSPCGKGWGEGSHQSARPFGQGDWSCPAPLTPTLSRDGRGSQKSLRPRVLLLIQRYCG